MINITRIRALVLRQYYLIKGSPSRILPQVVWVAIDIVLWGFITKYLSTINLASVNFISVMLGAILLWDLFTRVMHGVTIAFFEDVWSRNFLNIFASPVSIPDYLASLVITSIGTSATGLLAMLLIATIGFDLDLFVYGLMLFPFMLTLFISGVALGILGSSIVLKLGPAAEWFVWPIPALLSPFVGVFYPITTLPVWMQYISVLLPPTYVFEAMRAIISNQAVAWDALGISLLLACCYVLLSCWFFNRTYKHAVKTGLIARYSAESIA